MTPEKMRGEDDKRGEKAGVFSLYKSGKAKQKVNECKRKKHKMDSKDEVDLKGTGKVEKQQEGGWGH